MYSALERRFLLALFEVVIKVHGEDRAADVFDEILEIVKQVRAEALSRGVILSLHVAFDIAGRDGLLELV